MILYFFLILNRMYKWNVWLAKLFYTCPKLVKKCIEDGFEKREYYYLIRPFEIHGCDSKYYYNVKLSDHADWKLFSKSEKMLYSLFLSEFNKHFTKNNHLLKQFLESDSEYDSWWLTWWNNINIVSNNMINYHGLCDLYFWALIPQFILIS